MPASHKETEGVKAVSISDLRATLQGRVISPGDPDYDKARSTFYGGIDRRPAAIVQVANAEDVSRVVSLVREDGLELAIRSGGHSIAGHCVTEGGIVLDVSAMQSLHLDVERLVAWAGSGLTAGAYSVAASAHGLATGFGDSGSVGVGGITLAGGIGYLARKHGLTIDSLVAVEIVTADGKLVHVDCDEYPDLFWALRGGGGNFGVVTRFQFRLHHVGPIVGGMLILPATSDVIASFVAAAEQAPEELSTIANVMHAPPMPFLPVEVHGRPVIMASLVYAGDVEQGKRIVGPFRTLATPIIDMLKPMPYPEIFPPEIPGYRPLAIGRTMFVNEVTRTMAESILDHLNKSTAQIRVAQIRVLGGAITRVPHDATAYAHRARRILVNVAAVYEQPGESQLHSAWVADFVSVLQPAPGAYVGFLGNEGEGRIHEAYPGRTWERLLEIKRRYDPTNLFRLNQNIRPAGNGAPH